jgi:hypothetical protein
MLFGVSVQSAAVCIRPRGNADPPEMTAYICHGRHVTAFSRPSAGTYVITLDRDYEADEVVVMAFGMGALDDLVSNPFGLWSSDADPPVAQNGIVSIATTWQTGPNGEKNMRTVVCAALDLGSPAVPAVTFIGKHSDPVTIVILFLDRTRATFRNPALP